MAPRRARSVGRVMAMRSTTPSRASATLTAFGELEMTIPYHAEALREAVKETIPKRYRAWDPDTKTWRIMGASREAAIALLLEYCPTAEVAGDRPRPRR